MKCISCGAEIAENVKFCTSCGTPVAKQAVQPEQEISAPKCASCGAELNENVKFCIVCGAAVVKQTPPAPVVEPVVEEIPVEPVVEQAIPAPVVEPVVEKAPAAPVYVPPVAAPQQQVVLPRENKPLGAWAYYGLQLLFSIPLVGFICLIVFSLDNGNIHRRNFARSYWCRLIVTLVLIIIGIILLLTLVGAENIPYLLEDLNL